MASEKSYKFIGTIKIGSSYSGYAYSFREDFTQNPLKIGIYSWPVSEKEDNTQKTLSSIVFGPDKKFKGFGYSALENYDSESGDLYFHRFPAKTTVLNESTRIKAKNGIEMPALDIYAAAVEYLSYHLTSKIYNRVYNIPHDEMLWTLIDSHPECKNQEFLIKAAREGGIQGELRVLHKTDAAVTYHACACRCRGENFSPKSNYLIIDATAQHIIVSLYPIKITHILSQCGGDTFNEEIRALLKKVSDSQKAQYTDRQIAYLDSEIENQKRKLKKPYVKKEFCIDSRYGLAALVSKQAFRHTFQGTQYEGKITMENEKVRIDYDVVQKILNESAEKVVQEIKNLIQTKAIRDVKDILMIGGYSESLFLQTAVRKNFPDTTIHVPMEAGVVDLKGAAISGYIPDNADVGNQRKLHLSITSLIDSMKVRTQKARNIRVIVVGQEGVGKTSLCMYLMKETVDDNIESTNGIDIFIQRFSVDLVTKKLSKLEPGTESDNVIKRLCNMLSADESEELNKKIGVESGYNEKTAIRTGNSNDNGTKSERNRTSFGDLVKQQEIDEVSTEPSLSTSTSQSAESTSKKNRRRQKLTSSVSIDELDNEELERLFQRIESVEDPNNREAFMSLWDCGGQESFYNTHHIFFSSDAVYLIVLNMKECMGPNKRQAIERLTHWLRAVGTYTAKDNKRTPPVILVGTHLDEIEGTEEEVRETLDELQDELCEIPDMQCMKGNLRGFYEVANTMCDSIQHESIMKAIIEAAEYQQQWEKVIPAKWLLLEEAMMRRKTGGVKIMTFEEIKEMDKTCGVPIKDGKEIKLFLRYMHSTGLILFFGEQHCCKGQKLAETIILDVQWLADAFRCIITAPKFIPKQNKTLNMKWRFYRKTAKLEEDFLCQIWKQYEKQKFSENQTILVCFMERLGLIAKPKLEKNLPHDTKQTYYLVPCMLEHNVSQEMPNDFKNRFTVYTRTLCLVFKDRFVPFPIFDKLLAACIENYVVYEEEGKTFLRKGFGVFRIDGLWSLIVCCGHHKIRLQLFKRSPHGTIEPGIGISVRLFIEDALKQITDLYKHKNLDYDYHLQCKIDNINCHSSVPKYDLDNHGYVPCCNGDLPVFLAKRELWYWFSNTDKVLDIQDEDDIPLSSEVLDRLPKDTEIVQLSLRLGKDYHLLFHALNLDSNLIEQIHLQYKEESITTKFMYMFKAWIKNQGDKSTIRRIINSMRSVDMDITEICNLFTDK